MRVLVADDDRSARLLVERLLTRTYEVVTAHDGAEAWQVLAGDRAPELAVLDWEMPHLSGVEICRRLREEPSTAPLYLIVLTSRDRMEDVVAALQAGADDYITKPFHPEELRVRVQVGARVVALQRSLADRVRALEEALAREHRLQGLLPICAWCKRVRNDQNYWQAVEVYVAEHSEAQFTHGICPECRNAIGRRPR